MVPIQLLLFARAGVDASDAGVAEGGKPHILFILVDDLGRAELGYQRKLTPTGPTHEVQTPEIDALVAQGVRLDRHYVHKFCSPTRSAIQSGRAPIHVNTINAAPDVANPEDPVAGYAGIARNMTGIAEVMRRAGYRTHFAGKWDAGMATPQHTPSGRGYESTLHYFHHANDYWTFRGTGNCKGAKGSVEMADLWNMRPSPPQMPWYGRGAKEYMNDAQCTDAHQRPGKAGGACVYEDILFEERIKQTIEAHDTKGPLFAFWATHIVHGPLQVPDAQLARFNFINDSKTRQTYHSMVNWIDGAIGRVVAKLRAKSMWRRTLIVFSSDNGGPISGGANNYPLRGGKFSNWGQSSARSAWPQSSQPR